MAVVKANAYGHGLIEVARAALSGDADRLGVALVEEGLALRRAGVDDPILVLSEAPVSAARSVVESNLTPTVYSEAAARALNAAATVQGVELPVHIKVDTGMHRVGVRIREAGDLIALVEEMPGLRVEGVLTHFACADNPQDSYTTEQLQAFLALRADWPSVGLWHAANSAAAIFLPEAQLDMVRIGIAMYGLQPSNTPSPVLLEPALSLKARVAFIQELGAGEGVSYGLTFRADSPTRAATVPIGYGDGFPRLLSNKGEVLVAGRRAALIGNICMDQSLIDLDALPVGVDDEVVLIGRQGDERISAEEIAAIVGTINYEIVCMINERVPRIYVNQ